MRRAFMKILCIFCAAVMFFAAGGLRSARCEPEQTPIESSAPDEQAPISSPDLPSASPDSIYDSKVKPLDTSKLCSATAYLMDADSTQTLVDKDAENRMYPASTTKVMTCLLAMERLSAGDVALEDVVTITKDVNNLGEGAMHIGLQPDEEIKFEDLLFALMLPSANDSAIAIAVHLAGSEAAFVEQMNAKAQELGCTGTHFVNPHGMFEEDHYTTAKDLATIFHAALAYPKFRELISTPTHTIEPTNKMDETRYLATTNKMISTSPENKKYNYEYCVGGKTGYTTPSRHTVVTLAEKDGQSLIGVVMKCEADERWTDLVTMFEYGFANYNTVSVSSLMEQVDYRISVKNYDPADAEAGQLAVKLVSEDAQFITDSRANIQALLENVAQADIEPDFDAAALAAPITQDQALGAVSVKFPGRDAIRANALASRSVAAKAGSTIGAVDNPADTLKTQSGASGGTLQKLLSSWWFWLLIVSVGALILLILASRPRKRRRKPARRAPAQRPGPTQPSAPTRRGANRSKSRYRHR
ncbi:MAG: D-alanyl-D-alanine carboxypeptidase family protein [Christensenellales bacterium]|jgi:D-alanyl-D-alanine carboxypeptidase (penicillin-binding protein 5/6)